MQEEPDTRIFLQIQVLYFVLLRLKQMQCFWAKAIDGIYDSDPKVNPQAKKYNEISIQEIIDKS